MKQIQDGMIDETLDKLSHAAEIDQILISSGLNWKVNKVTLTAPDGEQAPYVGLQRDDNCRVIGVRKPGYEPFQNEQLAELIYRMSQATGLEMVKGFELNGGSKVSLQLKSNTFKGIGENNGTINTNITAVNSFDGSTGLGFGSTQIDIVCKNTFFAAYKQLQFKFRHTKGMQLRIDRLLPEIPRIQKAEEGIFQEFKRMAEIPLTTELAYRVIKELNGVDLALSAKQLQEEYSIIKINQAKEIMMDIKEEASYKGNTAWGLFSGITKYTTHEISAPKRENGRLWSKMFGNAHNFDKKAYSILTSN